LSFFTQAGGLAAKHVAKWNGSSWTALGTGMIATAYPVVLALTVSGSDLYVGGGFTTSGDKMSAYIARAYLPALPTLSGKLTKTRPSVERSGMAALWELASGKFAVMTRWSGGVSAGLETGATSFTASVTSVRYRVVGS
jgi:hypothetical protein